MRVISGKYGSRKLKSIEANFRPTSDRIRESLFNMLGRLSDCIFLDLYAGVGTVGIEAISRGARSTFVESDGRIIKVLQKNLNTLKISPDEYEVISGKVLKAVDDFLNEDELKFSVVFADPPYASDASDKLFHNLGKIQNLILDGGSLVVQESSKKNFPKRFDKVRKIGNSKLGFIYE